MAAHLQAPAPSQLAAQLRRGRARPAPARQQGRPHPPCLSSGPGLAQESSRCHAGGASSAAVLAIAASSGDREVPAKAEPSASARAPSPRTNGQARCRAVPNRAVRGPPRTTLLGRRRHAQPSDAAPRSKDMDGPLFGWSLEEEDDHGGNMVFSLPFLTPKL